MAHRGTEELPSVVHGRPVRSLATNQNWPAVVNALGPTALRFAQCPVKQWVVATQKNRRATRYRRGKSNAPFFRLTCVGAAVGLG